MSQPSPWVDRSRVFMLAAFAALPFATSSAVQEHVYVRIPYLLMLATLVWVAAGTRASVSAWVPPRPPFTGIAAVWLTLAALSMYWAKSRELVPVEVFRDFVIITAAGAFAMLAAPRRPLALMLLACGAALALGYALFDHLHRGDPYLWPPFYQPSLAGGLAAVIFAGSLSAILAAPPRTPRGRLLVAAGAALALLAAVVLWRTNALTATGAAAAGCAAGFLALRGTWGRRLALLVPLLALIAGGGILYYYGAVLHHPSAHIRLLLWEGAWNMLCDHPWGGVGYGCFGASFPLYRPEGYWDALYATGWTNDAHSLYLELGATLGIPGLLLPTIFVPLALCGGLRLARGAATGPERAASAAAVGAFTAIAVAAIADLPADYPLGRFLFFALAGVAYSRTAKEDIEHGRSIDLLARRGLLIGVGLLLIVQCTFVEAGLVRSRIAYRLGELRASDAEALFEDWDAVADRPATNPERMLIVNQLTATIRASMEEYDRAVSLSPFDTPWTLRARLAIATEATHLARILPVADTFRFEVLRLGQSLCAEVEKISPDFEENELIYALIERELGNSESFESHMRSYLEQRLGWDLRAAQPGVRGPQAPAWRYILETVPPRSPFFQWVQDRIEAAAAAATPTGQGIMVSDAVRVRDLYREKSAR